MLDILAITGPIYITIALGFLSVRRNLFTRADMRVFGKFVLNFALPALLFGALAQRKLSEVLNPSYLTAYALGSMSVILLVLFWARKGLGKSRSASAYFAMGMTCSNSGYVGYPVLMLTLGPVAGVVLALNMLIENLLKLPFLMAVAETDPGPDGEHQSVGQVLWQTVLRLLKNPMIIGILAGTLVAAMGWKLPQVVERTVSLFSLASGPLALFVIGGSLVGLEVRGMRSDVARIALGKLILHPLAVLLAVLALPYLGFAELDATFRTAAVLSAAMPMIGIYAILAQRHGHDAVSAAALLATTVASFFSLSILLWVLRQLPGWLG